MARSNNDALQATYLNDLRKQRVSVIVYFLNGLKQIGMIESFDQHALLLRQGTSMQLIDKHMIGSIMPAPKAMPSVSSPPAKRAVSRPALSSTPVVIRKVSRRTIVREE